MFWLTFLQLTLFLGAQAVPLDSENERYIWFPDGEGKLHLIDLQDDSEPAVKFSPEEDIRYLLYTRQNPTEYQEIKKGDLQSLLNSNFDGQKPVKFTIHGWTANYLVISNTNIRDAFFDIDDVNMITIDWEIGASAGYIQSIRNAISAGPSIAEFIDWLNEETGVSFSTMHIIGHSLGGQLSGMVGRHCTRGVVEYITALDPAHPLFGTSSERIRKTDANYVEVIHTNSGILGMRDAVGHNDFYPNGGRDMTGCNDFSCSHIMCIYYMEESIRNGGFTGIECASEAEAHSGVESCTGTRALQMGGAQTKPEYGIFALDTNANSPYSQG